VPSTTIARIFAVLWAFGAGGCLPVFQGECTITEIDGIAYGQAFTLTVGAQLEDQRASGELPSCDGLSDLPVGTTITATATLTADGGDACASSVDLQSPKVATLDSMNGASVVRAQGCTGAWSGRWQSSKTGPTFVLRREWHPTGGPATCPTRTCANFFAGSHAGP
jgi:hypothetical protein